MKTVDLRYLKSALAVTLAGLLITESIPASAMEPVPSTFPTISVPSRLGYVTDAYSRSNSTKPDVILIQNLHVNRSVQFAISGILKSLQLQNLLPNTIAVEGATGVMDTASMQAYPDATVRTLTSDYLVRQGEMPGAMHFVVAEGKGQLYGVETDDVYEANLQAFRHSYENRQRLSEELEKLARVLPHLKRTPELKSKAEVLEKDVLAVQSLVNLQVIPDELSLKIHQSLDSIERLQQILPPDVASSLMPTLSGATNFYAFAEMRNEDLFKNTLQLRTQTHQATTVLITGGFHTQSLTEQFKQAGLSYVVITPLIAHRDRVDDQLYVDRMLGKHLTTDQVATGIDWTAQMAEPPYEANILFGPTAAHVAESRTVQGRINQLKAISMLVIGMALGLTTMQAQTVHPANPAHGGAAQPQQVKETPQQILNRMFDDLRHAQNEARDAELYENKDQAPELRRLAQLHRDSAQKSIYDYVWTPNGRVALSQIASDSHESPSDRDNATKLLAKESAAQVVNSKQASLAGEIFVNLHFAAQSEKKLLTTGDSIAAAFVSHVRTVRLRANGTSVYYGNTEILDVDSLHHDPHFYFYLEDKDTLVVTTPDGTFRISQVFDSATTFYKVYVTTLQTNGHAAPAPKPQPVTPRPTIEKKSVETPRQELTRLRSNLQDANDAVYGPNGVESQNAGPNTAQIRGVVYTALDTASNQLNEFLRSNRGPTTLREILRDPKASAEDKKFASDELKKQVKAAPKTTPISFSIRRSLRNAFVATILLSAIGLQGQVPHAMQIAAGISRSHNPWEGVILLIAAAMAGSYGLFRSRLHPILRNRWYELGLFLTIVITSALVSSHPINLLVILTFVLLLSRLLSLSKTSNSVSATYGTGDGGAADQPTEVGLVRLRNGQYVPRVTVAMTMISLKDLLNSRDPRMVVRNGVAFYELVQKARDPQYRIDETVLPFLQQRSLVEDDGSLHDSIASIVNSAAVGEDLDLSLRSPIDDSVSGPSQITKNPGEAGFTRRGLLVGLGGVGGVALVGALFGPRVADYFEGNKAAGEPIALYEEYGRGENWYGRWGKLTDKEIRDIHQHPFLRYDVRINPGSHLNGVNLVIKNHEDEPIFELHVEKTPDGTWSSSNHYSNEPVRLMVKEHSADSLSVTISRVDIDNSLKNLNPEMIRDDKEYAQLHFQKANHSDVSDLHVSATPIAAPESETPPATVGVGFENNEDVSKVIEPLMKSGNYVAVRALSSTNLLVTHTAQNSNDIKRAIAVALSYYQNIDRDPSGRKYILGTLFNFLETDKSVEKSNDIADYALRFPMEGYLPEYYEANLKSLFLVGHGGRGRHWFETIRTDDHLFIRFLKTVWNWILARVPWFNHADRVVYVPYSLFQKLLAVLDKPRGDDELRGQVQEVIARLLRHEAEHAYKKYYRTDPDWEDEQEAREIIRSIQEIILRSEINELFWRHNLLSGQFQKVPSGAVLSEAQSMLARLDQQRGMMTEKQLRDLEDVRRVWEKAATRVPQDSVDSANERGHLPAELTRQLDLVRAANKVNIARLRLYGAQEVTARASSLAVDHPDWQPFADAKSGAISREEEALTALQEASRQLDDLLVAPDINRSGNEERIVRAVFSSLFDSSDASIRFVSKELWGAARIPVFVHTTGPARYVEVVSDNASPSMMMHRIADQFENIDATRWHEQIEELNRIALMINAAHSTVSPDVELSPVSLNQEHARVEYSPTWNPLVVGFNKTHPTARWIRQQIVGLNQSDGGLRRLIGKILRMSPVIFGAAVLGAISSASAHAASIQKGFSDVPTSGGMSLMSLVSIQVVSVSAFVAAYLVRRRGTRKSQRELEGLLTRIQFPEEIPFSQRLQMLFSPSENDPKLSLEVEERLKLERAKMAQQAVQASA